MRFKFIVCIPNAVLIKHASYQIVRWGRTESPWPKCTEPDSRRRVFAGQAAEALVNLIAYCVITHGSVML